MSLFFSDMGAISSFIGFFAGHIAQCKIFDMHGDGQLLLFVCCTTHHVSVSHWKMHHDLVWKGQDSGFCWVEERDVLM